MSESVDKRDKKGKKKLKRGEKETDKPADRSTTPPLQLPPVASITDVFADVVMQKARKTLGDTAAAALKTKAEPSKAPDGTNDFDIPTISEIAKDAVTKSTQRKEITELAELQKKINEAKRQLRHMTDESEDEDFINIRADNNDLDPNFRKEPAKEKPLPVAVEPVGGRRAEPQTEKEESDRRSVRDRLGTKAQNDNIVSLSAHRRVEQAIYVPAFRRSVQESAERRERRSSEGERSRVRGRSVDREREKDRDRNADRSRDRSARPVRDLRERVRVSDRLGAKASREPDRISKVDVAQKRGLVSKRIGSRVIVAPKRSKSDVENEIVVSSVVSVKARPILPSSKQASKNLLLRAVAEAQKSTALVKPKPEPQIGLARVSKELYTKSFKANKRLAKGNIIVKVETGGPIADAVIIDDDSEVAVEYVPASDAMEEDDYEYVPQPISSPEG